jgi:FAD:protein FMN transferase
MLRLTKTAHPITSGLLFLIACAVLLSCSSEVRKYHRRIFALDTVVDITVFARHDPGRILDSVARLITEVDSLLSISNPSSDIWKINHRQSPEVAVSSVTDSLVRFCNAECDLSGGMFDITVAPLKYLYGLESHQNANHVPSDAELDSVAHYIGCGRLHTHGNTNLTLDSGVTIDFGGIAKGYLVRRLKRLLLREGIDRFLVNLGGDLIAWGEKPDSKQWIVGVRHPRIADSLIAVLPAASTCVFTSGDYERYFIENGVRYHHLFDPHTCKPARKNQSSTVIGPDPLIDDICVKAAFMMEAPAALDYYKRRGLEGAMIDSVGVLWVSASLRDRLQILDPATRVEYR